jgi:hypothetical protein
MNVINRNNMKSLKAKYNKFMSGMSEKNMEQLLEAFSADVQEVKIKNTEIEKHINHIERNLIQCIQKVGIIRFNPFENVGSDQSFAIALLDNGDNGVVISGIYARDGSSTYAKPVLAGKSKYPLSGEEVQAIENAKKLHGERIYM